MKYLLIVSMLLVGPGCREVPVESDISGVVLKTDKREYGVQERILLEMENQTSDPILQYDCFEIDQLIEDHWEFVGYWWECQSISHRVQVGSQASWGRSGLDSEGEYRIAVDILHQEDWRQRERVVSGRFIVKADSN